MQPKKNEKQKTLKLKKKLWPKKRASYVVEGILPNKKKERRINVLNERVRFLKKFNYVYF